MFNPMILTEENDRTGALVKVEIYFDKFNGLDNDVVYQLLRKYGVVTPRKLNKIINKIKMITRFSKLYKSITEQKDYLNYLIFILILEETAPKHLQVFYGKINRLEITTGNIELSKINQFVVDEMSSDDFEKIGSENKNRENEIYDLERKKNPAYKWGENNHTKISTPQFVNMKSYISDINKFI